jgi:hypothetical protein
MAHDDTHLHLTKGCAAWTRVWDGGGYTVFMPQHRNGRLLQADELGQDRRAVRCGAVRCGARCVLRAVCCVLCAACCVPVLCAACPYYMAPADRRQLRFAHVHVHVQARCLSPGRSWPANAAAGLQLGTQRELQPTAERKALMICLPGQCEHVGNRMSDSFVG